MSSKVTIIEEQSVVIIQDASLVNGTGASSFVQLTDTPNNYNGQALKALRVNSLETGLEFATINIAGEANTASNVGSGEGLYKEKLGVDLRFKSLTAGLGIQLTNNANDVQIQSTITQYTNADAKAAAVQDSIADGITDVAPSQNAVFDALATKLNTGLAVLRADYTPAYSILAQQSGTGSPSIVEVGNNTLVGRLSGGGAEIEDLSVSDVKNLLSFADRVQTDFISGVIESPEDGDYRLLVNIPVGFTITNTTTRSVAGTGTATFKINTTALGGTANSVSTSEQTQAHASDNVAVAGDDIVLTMSSVSALDRMSFTIEITRTLI